MTSINTDKIETFLRTVQDMSQEKYEIIAELRNYIASLHSDIIEDFKYNGIVYLQNDELIVGLFNYAKHTAVDFMFGNALAKNNPHLEGSGKLRRHFKLTSLADIKNKNVCASIAEAFGFC